MTVSEFNLPDVGEGLVEAEIVSWKVQPGDTVEVNTVLVDIETEKSLVELPSPYAGVVEKLMVDEGATVPVGTPIIAVRTGSVEAQPDVGNNVPSQAAGHNHDLVPAPPEPPNQDGGQAMLVGYGPRAASTRRRPRKTSAVSEPATELAAPSPPAATAWSAPTDRQDAKPASVLAKPPVRKLAKDLGVDITTVVPSGAGGTVTRDDIHAATAPGGAHAPHAGPGWDGHSREERIPIRSVRKSTAKAVTQSAFTAPHVSEFVTVDVTRTVKLVERLRASREFRDVKLSPLAVLAKAMCIAVRRSPEVNARWDDEAGEIVLQRYVNLGVAAATPRGLVVPNVKDADRLPLRELAVAINELAATARDGATPPADMAGGTMSITNVGVFGIDTGTPILPPGEAAIIAFGAIRKQPWVHKDKVKPRHVTTLSVSFDHRLVDGEQGSRFLADVAGILEDPGNALVWG